MNKKYFLPYNKISADKLRIIAEYINNFDIKELEEFLLNDFKKYFGPQAVGRLPSYSIEIKPLLKVPNALVVITFNSHPFINPDLAIICGFTRTPKQDIKGALPVPVVYLMPNRSKNIFKHETIHVCQYLQDSSFPLTTKQKELFLSTDLTTGANYIFKTDGEEAMTNFVLNAVCYKTWIELEANYYTRGRHNAWEWIYQAYKSSCPITTFNGLSSSIPWKGEYMKKMETGFIDFCNLMEQEVTWIQDATKYCKMCFYDIMMDMYEEFECDMMFDDFKYMEMLTHIRGLS